MGLTHNRDVLARTTTDKEGRFNLSRIPIPPRMDEIIDSLEAGDGGAEVLAWADGMGLNFAQINQVGDNPEVRLQLTPEAKVVISLRDDAGSPIPNARLTVWGLTRAAGQYDPFLKDMSDLNLSLSEVDFGGTTDELGNLTVAHLPVDRRIITVTKCPGFAQTSCAIDTGSNSSEVQLSSDYKTIDPVTLVRSPATIELKPTRFALVKVSDHDGRPMTNGAINVVDSARHMAGWEKVAKDGTAKIPFPKSGSFDFHYAGDPLEPVLATWVSKEISSDDKSPEIDITLPAIRWLTGTVVDAETDKGVPGAYLGYASTVPGSIPRFSSVAVSGADGKFRIPVVPGFGSISFRGQMHGYYSPSIDERRNGVVTANTVEIPESGEVPSVTISLGKGMVISGTVLGADGKPAGGVKVHGERPARSVNTQTDEAGHYELSGLSPLADVQLTFSSPTAATIETVAGDPKYQIDKIRRVALNVNLKTGIALTGRILKNKQPQAGVKLSLHRSRKQDGNRVSLFAEAVTDAEGRFSVGGLAEGDQYYFEIRAADGSYDPSWKHQMPYLASIREGAKGEIKLPDVNLIGANQTLRGVVLDPAGKPVPGVQVTTQLALPGGRTEMISRPDRSRGVSRLSAQTNQDGRFALTGLPDLPIEIMVYKPNPQGGVIRRASKVRPELNQQEIRVLFDPALDEPIEDLDSPKGAK
jgi:5-hydroxyisourate hydrolase-like protein (transthyretin family)